MDDEVNTVEYSAFSVLAYDRKTGKVYYDARETVRDDERDKLANNLKTDIIRNNEDTNLNDLAVRVNPF